MSPIAPIKRFGAYCLLFLLCSFEIACAPNEPAREGGAEKTEPGEELMTGVERRDTVTSFEGESTDPSMTQASQHSTDQNLLMTDPARSLLPRTPEDGSSQSSQALQQQVIHLRDILMGQDLPEARKVRIRELSGAWLAGDINAAVKLGHILEEGVDQTVPDTVQAFEIFLLAAEEGNAQAQYEVARYLRHGLAGIQDLDAAIQWYESAAEQGHADSWAELGHLIIERKDGEANSIMGIEYFKQAAELGSTDAQFYLGSAYMDGSVVEVDRSESIYYLEMAAQGGNVQAMRGLFHLYANAQSPNANSEKALVYAQKLAEMGDPDGMFQLAMAYTMGTLTPRDPALAEYWLEEAAKSNDVQALYLIGSKLTQAESPEATLGTGRDFLKKATLLGHESACIELLMNLLSDPRGGDEADVEEWFQYAGDAGMGFVKYVESAQRYRGMQLYEALDYLMRHSDDQEKLYRLLLPPRELDANGNAPPRPYYMPKPVFPTGLKMEHYSERVVLGCIIDADGVPFDIEALENAHPLLVEAAIDSFSQWRFEPALAGGKPVETKVRIPMKFTYLH